MYRDIRVIKVYGSYVVTLLDQTSSMLKWHDLAQLISTPLQLRMDTKKARITTRFGLRAQNIDIALESIFSANWEGMCDDSKRKKILTLTTYQFYI